MQRLLFPPGMGAAMSVLLTLALCLSATGRSAGNVVIANRPFGMDLATWHPHADGFFDASIGEQIIGVYLLNQGTQTITNASAVASFSPESGIVLTQPVSHFGDLHPGIPTLGFFKANFSAASPDKHALHLNVSGNSGSFSQSTSRNLFLTNDVHDPIDVNTWTMFAPEGRITTQVLSEYGGHNPGSITAFTEFNWTVEYNTPFTGQFSPLPYEDPFWKAFAAGFGIGGSAVWVVGAIVKRCGNEKDGDLLINVGQAEKGAGGIGLALDLADPFRRGQQNTFPGPGERTMREAVHLTANYLTEPVVGTPWDAQVNWTYQRITDAGSYTFSVNELVQNQHFTNTRLLTINQGSFVPGQELVLTASAFGPGTLSADRAIFIANILPADDASYDNIVRTVVMRDDGQGGDVLAGDGIYTGTASTAGFPAGVQLAAYVFGFDINNAAVTDPPLVAAQEIGGLMISAPQFGECTIQPDFRFQMISVGMISSAWNVDASGTWSSGTNWTSGAVPNGVDHIANFGTIITSSRTVTVDAPQWVGNINFFSAPSYTIAGPGTLTLDVSSGTAGINVGQGTHVIAAPVILNDDATINVAPGAGLALTGPFKATGRSITKNGAGSVQFERVGAATLNVFGGSAIISVKGMANSPGGTSRLNTLSIAGGARLDLNNNSLVIDAGSLATTTAQIKTALENGGNFDWLGPGIGSTQANVQNTAAGSFLYGLGVILNDLSQVGGSGPIYTDFAGVSGLTGTEVLVKFTYFGDADLSGSIDATDYSLIDNGYVNSLTGWINGDFDYSGSIDATDYALIDNAYVNQAGPLAETVIAEHTKLFGGEYVAALNAIRSGVIPEPSSIWTGVASLVAAGASQRSRARRRCKSAVA